MCRLADCHSLTHWRLTHWHRRRTDTLTLDTGNETAGVPRRWPPPHTRLVSCLSATHRCNTLQHVATLYNTLQHTHLDTRVIQCLCAPATHCNTLQHTTTHCITLHHTATHCNTLQHTASNLVCFSTSWQYMSLGSTCVVLV